MNNIKVISENIVQVSEVKTEIREINKEGIKYEIDRINSKIAELQAEKAKYEEQIAIFSKPEVITEIEAFKKVEPVKEIMEEKI